MIKGTKNTRQRVLESACVVFAEKGYRDATIAEICECASANVAYPLDAGISDETSNEQRLFAFISGMLRRMERKSPTGYFSMLVAKEMADPTCGHQSIFSKFIEPEKDLLFDIISKLLNYAVKEKQVRLCAMSVIYQCVILDKWAPLDEPLMNGPQRCIKFELKTL